MTTIHTKALDSSIIQLQLCLGVRPTILRQDMQLTARRNSERLDSIVLHQLPANDVLGREVLHPSSETVSKRGQDPGGWGVPFMFSLHCDLGSVMGIDD